MVLQPKILTVDEYQRVVEAKLGATDFKILSLREAPLEQRVGFLADHSRVHVDVQRADGRRHTLCFFAKAMPANANCRAMIEENGSFQREIFFYDVLARHFEAGPMRAKTFPTCYLAKPEVLILEDLAPLGFGPVRSTHEAVDLDHCHQVLEGLARFHCASMATEQRLQQSLRDAFPEHMYEVFFTEGGRAASWWRCGLHAARALLPLLPRFQGQPAEARRLQDRFQGLGATLLHALRPQPHRRNVMCHGDSWVSNFLFKYAEGKPDHAVLLDFQLMRYAPPVYDVQLFLTKSLAYSEARARHHDALLRFYRQRLQHELSAAGLDAVPEAEFLETALEAGRMATIAVVLYSQVCNMPTEFVDMLFADQALYDKYMFTEGGRAEYVTKIYHADKHFRYVFEHAVGELADMVLADE